MTTAYRFEQLFAGFVPAVRDALRRHTTDRRPQPPVYRVVVVGAAVKPVMTTCQTAAMKQFDQWRAAYPDLPVRVFSTNAGYGGRAAS